MLPSDHNFNHFLKSGMKPHIMGILNITPDSFSDGNLYFNTSNALERVREMIDEGAEIIDIGAESSRPGSKPVKSKDQIQRIIPVLKGIRAWSEIPVSIDTRDAETARIAILEGANIVNDISSLQHDERMISVLSEFKKIMIVLMHMQGTPENMQINPAYDDVLDDIKKFFNERIDYSTNYGISQNRIFLDPGIGFGKTAEHNLTILRNLKAFKGLGLPLVVGASRKSFINAVYPSHPKERLPGSLAAAYACLEADIEIIRVHDVKETVQFFKIIKSIIGQKQA